MPRAGPGLLIDWMPRPSCQINRLDEAITLATLPPFAKVAAGEMLATIKIIPFAAREASVAAAETMLASSAGLRVDAFRAAAGGADLHTPCPA